MQKFLGGTNLQELAVTLERCMRNKWIPILDYAREGSLTKEDVVNYTKKMDSLAGLSPAYALKLSSFAPLNPAQTMDYTIANLIEKGAKTIFLDAESVAQADLENNIFNSLIKKYNANEPILYKTYQMYKRNPKIMEDLQELPNLSAKLVRGAYFERDKHTGLLFDNIKDTHAQYNKYITTLHDLKIPTLVATHNTESINLAKQYSNSQFAQLLGMRDTLSSHLAQTHIVYKYVPYGTFGEMLPYLSRRFLENAAIARNMFS
jgi:hypothetical protein